MHELTRGPVIQNCYLHLYNTGVFKHNNTRAWNTIACTPSSICIETHLQTTVFCTLSRVDYHLFITPSSAINILQFIKQSRPHNTFLPFLRRNEKYFMYGTFSKYPRLPKRYMKQSSWS